MKKTTPLLASLLVAGIALAAIVSPSPLYSKDSGQIEHAAEIKELYSEMAALKEALTGQVSAREKNGQLLNRVHQVYQPGMIIAYGGAIIPGGWALCNGDILDGNQPEYAELYRVIRKQFGGGAGNQFRVPDLRGRTAIGTGRGQNLTTRGLGETLGRETHQLSLEEMPEHDHGGSTDTGGAHSHKIKRHTSDGDIEITWGDGGGSSGHRIDSAGGKAHRPISTDKEAAHSHSITSAGRDRPHNNMQPSIAVNYLIKL